MKTKLDKAWRVCKSRRRVEKWRVQQAGFSYVLRYPRESQIKFEEYACKVWGRPDLQIEWNDDGSCLVGGVMLFLPDA